MPPLMAWRSPARKQRWKPPCVTPRCTDIVSVVNTTLNQTGQAIEGILIIMGAYLTVSLTISIFMNWYNKRIALVER